MVMFGVTVLGKPPKWLSEKKRWLSNFRWHARFSEDGSHTLDPESLFKRLLSLERKRSERSRKQFALMLVDTGKLLQAEDNTKVLKEIVGVLFSTTRETDVRGWYRNDSVIGVILTEIAASDIDASLNSIFSKVTTALRKNLNTVQMNEIHLSFHVFPDDLDSHDGERRVDARLYPDLVQMDGQKKAALLTKRAIDVLGSLFALIVLSPVFAAIALAIKLTSKGPVFFKQTRVGQYGARFTFLKFRSMYFLNDPGIHREYVRRLIAGKEDSREADGKNCVYKIKEDPRITAVGRFLRRSSLDELPQFLNVLTGKMSLVGPRPPIPYETEAYDIWHRRRFLEVKPGITGLWQVKGRSKVKFDEMVRLDLQYAKTWSLGLDLKILIETPRAIFFGEGAY